MGLIVVGLSHKTARVEQREKAALAEPAARALLRDLRAGGAAEEAVALSTCNRTELYAVADDLPRAEQALCEALVAHTLISRPELECARYGHRDERVAAHLFRVVSSLDSMVLGESEIQAQVREAFELAAEEEAVGPQLDHLFRHGLEVGKRVRHETRIGMGPTSVSAVAVQLARQAASDLPGSRVLLIGAGQVAEAAARSLCEQGACTVVVANRTVGTARALAERFGGVGVGFDLLGRELAAADVVISSTEAPHAILRREDVAQALAGRPDRPMVLIDIAVPRDLDPAIAGLPGAALHDIDDLERVVEANLNGRVLEAERAEKLVAAELRRFVEWRRGLAVTPTISSLRARAEEIRSGELGKLAGQWESLSERDRERIEALTKAIVNKLLHEPTVRAREAAMTGEGLRELETLRTLFGLGVGETAKGPAPSS
jgi:glutamyl-tRNA reductase